MKEIANTKIRVTMTTRMKLKRYCDSLAKTRKVVFVTYDEAVNTLFKGQK